MNRILESHHLRLIAQVARTESVTRAADLLNVTLSVRATCAISLR